MGLPAPYPDGYAGELTWDLQRSLMIDAVPVLPRAVISGSYSCSREGPRAGGDWLDVVRDPAGVVHLVVGDVAGRGPRAAVAMGQLRTLLADRLGRGEALGAAMAGLAGWAARHPDTQGASACVVAFDAVTGKAWYCTAGHPPPLTVPAGEGEPWFLEPTGGGPIGSSGDEKAFPVLQAPLGEGDLLVLYSDGLLGSGLPAAPTATVRLRQSVITAVGSSNGRTFRHLAGERALAAMAALSVPYDDAAVLVLQRRPPPAPLRMVLPSVAPESAEQARLRVGHWLAAAAGGVSDSTAIEYAVTELVANVADHAYPGRPAGGPGRIDLELEEDGTVRLTVSDEGRWQSGSCGSGRGLGLPMVRKLVDQLDIVAGPDGNSVVVRTELTRPVLFRRPPAARAGETRPRATVEHLPPADATHLALRGVVDQFTAYELQAVIATLLEPGKAAVVVDLTEVEILSSVAVRVLRDAQRLAADKSVVLHVTAPAGSPAHEILSRAAVPHSGAPAATGGS